mmetsp:Transcript_42320/g.78828  ORF Transcript_42320/g.78828 Transcript_42320/m.78828 type:complete len:318 (-) Transcript_42320:175-1128(-)
MDGTDKDLGWEDVGTRGVPGGNIPSSAGRAHPGSQTEAPNISDAVTSAMMNQFARELTSSSLSLWPQFVQIARRYFNVHHGYVLRKMLWQLMPFHSTKKKSMDGELGNQKDWTVRIIDGLEVDIEEPDLYIPTMGFVTYVVLYGVVRGVQENFSPEVLSATISSALVILVVEMALMKGALFMAGAVNTPTFDLVALLGYKFFYLSVHLGLGLLCGRGRKPSGFFYGCFVLTLAVSCGIALWQALRRLARMQPSHGQECVTDMHQVCIKVLPVLQAAVCWLLLPSWPKAAAVTAPLEEVAVAVTTTVAAVLSGNSSAV